MPRLSFEIDWVDAEGIRGTELSATWAALQIRAGEYVVTRVLDARAKTVRDYVYVPVYPFAEWLATNWWFLTHEFGSPTKEGDPEFHRRHSLGANREGYAFPSLEAVSSRLVDTTSPGNGIDLHGPGLSSWTKATCGWIATSFASVVPTSSIR